MRQHNIFYATFICIIASLSGVMLGYDASVISGVIDPLSEHFSLTPAESGWAVSNVLIGCVLGACIVGNISNKYGRKATLIGTAVLFLLSAIGSALAPDFITFVIFRMIGGIAVGMASAITPLYIAEISPSKYRGRMLGLQQLLMVGGQMVVYIVNYLIIRGMTEEWIATLGWRWMLASEIVPIMMFLGLVFFMPESPRWLAMAGRDSKALAVLTKLSNIDHAKHLLGEIKASLKKEKTKNAVALSVGEALKCKRSRYIIFIGCAIATLQQFIGINILLYYAPSLLKNITASTEDSLFQTILIGAALLVGVTVALGLVDRIGRKPLLKWGSLGCMVCLLFTSYTFMAGVTGYTPVIGLVLYVAIFGLSWSLGAWLLISEIFPNRSRSVAMGISFCAMYVSNFSVTQTFPMMNESTVLMNEFNGAFPLIVCAGFCLVAYWFVERFLPETKGVTLEKIEPLMLSKSKHLSAEYAQDTATAKGAKAAPEKARVVYS